MSKACLTWYRGLAAIALSALACGAAQANSLSATYFAISASDPSYDTMCCGTYSNEVLSTLGPDNLPLFNTAYPGTPPNSADLHSTVDGQEITWWSPALNSHVTQIGTGTVTLPIDEPSNFYPCVVNSAYPCNDASYGLAAVYSGTLDAPSTESISFTIGADDSAFAYLDGQIVCDLGGVHGFTPGTCVTPFDISAGSHSLEVFFVDLNQSQAGLEFTVDTAGVTTTGGSTGTGVPEPGILGLVGLALGAIALGRRAAKS